MDQRSFFEKIKEITASLEGKKLIAGYLTALGLHSLADQDQAAARIFVYCRVTLPESEGILQLSLPFPDDDEIEEVNGILCVTKERAMKDLIDLYKETDVNVLMDVLANYYEEHGESYDDLDLSEEQDAILRKVIPDMLVLDCAWYS